MEKAGLVARSPADEDRRGVEIAFTGEGEAALVAAVESHLRLVTALLTDRLTPTDRAALTRILPKLLAQPKPDRSPRGD